MGITSRWMARMPLAAAAAGCFAGILSAEAAGGVGGWVVIPSAAMLVLMARRRWKLGTGVAAWVLLWMVHGPRLERQERAGEWVRQNGRNEVEVVGVVLSLRDRGGFLPRAIFRIAAAERNAPELRGAVVGVRHLPDEVKPGDWLLLRGRTSLPAGSRNPGEFDRLEWMRSCGLAAELRADHQEVAGHPRVVRALHRFAWEMRLGIRERIVAGLEEDSDGASLIRGLVLGDRSGGGEEFFGAFRQSGTMHIFAVSGLHVGLVGYLGWVLMGLCRVPRGWGLWGVLVIMWGYALVTGLRPPALRASLMASVFLVGFAVKRQPSLANSLLASIPPVLLLDSFQFQQAGFQLSYAVVAMIILLGPFLYRRVQFLVDGDPFLPRILYSLPQRWMQWLRQKTLGLLVVSLAAWMGSMPLIGYHFAMVTPAAVVASVLLIPVVFLILALAILGVVVGLVVQPLEEVVNRANGALAGGAYQIARAISAIPGSHFELRGGGGWPEGILVFDLWDGDAAVFCGAGEGVLIDGGAADQFRRVVAPALRQAGVAPRTLALTHPDGGHAGGLAPAVELYRVRQLLLPVREAGSPAFRQLLDRALASHCHLEFGVEGKRYPLGEGAELEVLRIADREHGSRADDRCMVLRLHWHGWRILFTGDAGFDTEKGLLRRGVDVQSDLWIMGRHRSDHTGTLEFVQAVAPRLIVAADESYPEAEGIPEWWAETIKKAGIELWQQTETGAVMVEVRKRKLELRSYLDPKRRTVLDK